MSTSLCAYAPDQLSAKFLYKKENVTDNRLVGPALPYFLLCLPGHRSYLKKLSSRFTLVLGAKSSLHFFLFYNGNDNTLRNVELTSPHGTMKHRRELFAYNNVSISFSSSLYKYYTLTIELT